MKNRLREELEAMLELRTGDSFTADNVHTLVNGIFAADEGGGFVFVEYDDNAFPDPQKIGDTTKSIEGLGNADENMIDTIFIMPNKETDPDATMMIVVDEVTPETNPKTYQYVYVGNINDLPSDVLTEEDIVNIPGTDSTSVMSQKGVTDLTSEYNVSANNNNTEYTFAQAVALVPVSLQKGGLTIKYIDSTSHEYTIKRLISSTWNTTESNWQAIDDEPTAESDNLVKSGGVFDELVLGAIYDVSSHNSNAIFTSLSELLNSQNISTLIPMSVRRGGMIIKFRESNNSYAQYMFIGTNIDGSPNPFLNTDNWQEIIQESKLEQEVFNDDICYYSKIERVEGTNFYTGKYFNTGSVNLPTPTELQVVSCMKIPCKGGDTFHIFAKASNSSIVQLWAFWKEDLSFNGKSDFTEVTYLRNKGVIITAPSGSAYLTVNMLNPIDTDCVYLINKLSKKDIDDVINKEIPTIKAPLGSKKIVCFGDSITEYADYNGKRYSDYIAEITGANVINVGVGGTRIEKRTTVVANPSNQTEAYAALDVMSLIDAVVEQNFTYQFAAVNSSYISSSTYLPIVQRLSEIDFNNVDAVTIFAGTNSWRTARALGTSGQTDSEYYMLSAVNLIIKKLLQAYPTIKIYWFTPMVRWIDNNGYTDNSWCDNFVLNGYLPGDLSLTLAQYKDYIKNEVVKNHIPVCDLYNELGINKFNFWNYFPNQSDGDPETDGTHPLKGMDVIGRKIASFIMSNLLIPY